MPSSRSNHVPTVINLVRRFEPRSILDIGVGFGKWGHLFREYTDIIASEDDPKRYYRENWLVRIDGIEGHAPYITPMHEFLYNQLFIGDMRDQMRSIGVYDIVFLGDVIEHLPKDDGREFLRACLQHASKAVIVSTPSRPVEQGALCGNEYEIHRSFWTENDFKALGRCVIEKVENNIMVAVLLCNGVSLPAQRGGFRGPPARIRICRRAKDLLRPLKPLLMRFGVYRPPVPPFPGSAQYGEQRYVTGGNSGLGSYGELAAYKAKVINDFVAENAVKSVIEFGAGDGNQLSMFRVPSYVGVDVSHTAVSRLRSKFAGNPGKEFVLFDDLPATTAADLGLSLDVIYHLVEDAVFDRYMRSLFGASRKFVIIYSSNCEGTASAAHVRDRRFTDWIDVNALRWKLTRHEENPYRDQSRAAFYFYVREGGAAAEERS